MIETIQHPQSLNEVLMDIMATTFTYDHYFVYEELSTCLQYFAKMYPGYMQFHSLVTTPEQREVYAVQITNMATGGFDTKPAYYMDGNTHAGEVTGSMAVMHFLDVILTNSHDPQFASLLDTTTFYLIPRISPDGAETYLATPHHLRSVNRPYPNKEQEDGLCPADIDGDGVIRKMRIRSAVGSWKESPDDPRVMVKRQPDDFIGDFYEVYDEGFLHGYQCGDINIPAPQWGLDFNRNYPFGWFVEARQPGAGEYPLSNIETKAVVDFVLQHPNIGFVATMHTTGGIVVYPPGIKPESEGFPKDMKMFRDIGVMATEEMGYPVVNVFDGFMQDQKLFSSGAFDDWCYHTQGIPSYTIELWDMRSRAGIQQSWPSKKTDTEQAVDFAKEVAWIDQHLGTDVCKAWTSFFHPQLQCEVEIGGYDTKYIMQNCPPMYLLQEMEKSTRFCLRNAKVLPRLALQLLSQSEVSDDVYKVEVEVANIGYLPTYLCDEAKSIKKDEPIKVVSHSSAEVLSEREITIPLLEGFSRSNSRYSYHGITSQSHLPQRAIVTYLVSGQRGQEVEVIASHSKAGIAKLKLVL